jgi:hypothetical protein
MSTLDSSWVMSAGFNGLVAHNSPAWLALYLAVCKLLDLALALPAQRLPQFQMYKWAFVSESTVETGGVDHGGDREAASPAGVAALAAASAATVVVNGGGVQLAPQHMLPGLPQQDFVPYVVRVAKLLLQKLEHVEATVLIEGEPQLTMTSINSLNDLAPFFASICQNVTRQMMTKDKSRLHNGQDRTKTMDEAEMMEDIDRIIEFDFLEGTAM